MSKPPVNLNLRRRLLPGLLALVAAVPLRILLRPLRRPGAVPRRLTVFSSYMVGDLYMALPALKHLARSRDIRVICRPDCRVILSQEGLDTIPFENAFMTRRNPAGFFETVRNAWRLRDAEIDTVLDFDADPRTAFWMRLAGASWVTSFQRPFGVLFDDAFPLPQEAVHQADRDMAVADIFLRGTADSVGNPSPLEPIIQQDKNFSEDNPWILSVRTRKASKNWPLERWSAFMEALLDQGIAFMVLHAPDGDHEYSRFREAWEPRVTFLEGSLEEVAAAAKSAAGVVATDNFFGHMGGYYGKPVLWINLSSPASQIVPKGPRTLQVEGDPSPETQRSGPTVETVIRAFFALRDGSHIDPSA